MVHQTITILTLTSMVVHAWMGCCRHHDHCVEAELSATCEHTFDAHDSDAHQRACFPDSSEHDGDHQNHDGQPCGAGNCKYAASPSVKVLNLSQSVPDARLTDSDTAHLLALHTRSAVLDASPSGGLPSMCAQESTQVWLL